MVWGHFLGLINSKHFLFPFFLSNIVLFLACFFYIITVFSLKKQKSLSNIIYSNFKKNILILNYINFSYFLISLFSFPFTQLYSKTNNLEFFFFEISKPDILSIVVLLICYFVSFITIMTFSDLVWYKNIEIPVIMFYFQSICYILISTDNLIIMFLCYELILLPAIYIVYKSAYSNQSTQAIIYFFIWTQVGSLFILVGISYIFIIKNSLLYTVLNDTYFSKIEKNILYILFFFGFGVKVPVWPLHYWLLKVHVEASTSFSIFLSGFLVKIGIFCFVSSTHFLTEVFSSKIAWIFCLVGMCDSALKLWGQEDLKKLVATTTVLDMNFTYFLFLFNDNAFMWSGAMSMVGHALLSTLMFYLVECIQQRTGTRTISKLYGLSNLYKNLGVCVWGMLLLFLGFPGTLKFFAEFRVLSYFSATNGYLVLLTVGFSLVLGAVGVAKAWLVVIYGQPTNLVISTKHFITKDLTKYEISIVLLVCILSFTACVYGVFTPIFIFFL